jgi:hypothetical protein
MTYRNRKHYRGFGETCCLLVQYRSDGERLSGGLYSKYEIGRTYRTHGSDEKCLIFFVGKPEGKRLGRHTHKREDNIRMDLRVVWWKGVNQIRLA